MLIKVDVAAVWFLYWYDVAGDVAVYSRIEEIVWSNQA